MIVVGLTGGIGHGKTTFADYLALYARKQVHFETSDIIIEVANALRRENPRHPAPDDTVAINTWLKPLPDILASSVHIEAPFGTIALSQARVKEQPENYTKLFEYLELMQTEPDLQRVEINDTNKQQFRSLLQWLGGYLVKVMDEGVWYDELVRRIKDLATRGVELVTVCGVRFPGDAERLRNAGGFIVEIQRPELEQPDSTDLTERERDLITPDSVVLNDASLELLRQCAGVMYENLKLRELKARYVAHDC